MTLTKLLEIIKQGENERIEFKQNLVSDIGKEICALANLEGGWILIGIDDNGKITGYQTNKLKDKITSFVLSILPPPKIKFFEFKIDHKKVMVVEIGKSKQICAIGNIAFIRIGTSKRALTFQELITQGVENLVLTIDRGLTCINFNQTDQQALDKFSQGRIGRGLGAATAEILDNLGIIRIKKNKKLLSLAGALCFLKKPQEYFPFSSVKIKAGSQWNRIQGSLFEIIEEAVQMLTKQSFAISFVSGARRKDVFMMPARIIRESVVNAIVHRNYSIESEVFIYMEDNRLRIINPGSFPPGVSPKDPRPVPRNPLLYEILFQTGYVEKEGGGINMILQESSALGIKAQYKLTSNFTELCFEKAPQTHKREIEILNLLNQEPFSAKEMGKMLGISKVAVLRYINSLKDKKKIQQIKKGREIKYVISQRF